MRAHTHKHAQRQPPLLQQCCVVGGWGLLPSLKSTTCAWTGPLGSIQFQLDNMCRQLETTSTDTPTHLRFLISLSHFRQSKRDMQQEPRIVDQRCDTATYACKRYETLKKGTFLLLTSAPAYCVVGAIKMQSSYVAVCYHSDMYFMHFCSYL